MPFGHKRRMWMQTYFLKHISHNDKEQIYREREKGRKWKLIKDWEVKKECDENGKLVNINAFLREILFLQQGCDSGKVSCFHS